MTELQPQLSFALGTLPIAQRIMGPRENWHFKKMDLNAFSTIHPSISPGELAEENAEKQRDLTVREVAFSALHTMLPHASLVSRARMHIGSSESFLFVCSDIKALGSRELIG